MGHTPTSAVNVRRHSRRVPRIAIDGHAKRRRGTEGAPQGALPAVLGRDVGAHVLLRDAWPPGAVHGGEDHRREPRLRILAARRAGDLRLVHRVGLRDAADWRLPRGSVPGPTSRRVHRRDPDDDWPLPDVRSGEGHLHVGAGLPHRGQRVFQAQHLDHGRWAVRTGRSAARRCVHHLLHGDQPRSGVGRLRVRNPRREDRLPLGLCLSRCRDGHRRRQLLAAREEALAGRGRTDPQEANGAGEGRRQEGAAHQG